MGRTVVDIDDRRVEVVNDIHLLEAKNKLIIVHVDISFNGFLRRWGLGGLNMIKDDFIPWKYVQPLSVEDAISTDKVALSVTRKDMMELPSEDLADILEELPGEEQQALFPLWILKKQPRHWPKRSRGHNAKSLPIYGMKELAISFRK